MKNNAKKLAGEIAEAILEEYPFLNKNDGRFIEFEIEAIIVKHERDSLDEAIKLVAHNSTPLADNYLAPNDPSGRVNGYVDAAYFRRMERVIHEMAYALSTFRYGLPSSSVDAAALAYASLVSRHDC